MVKLVCFSNKIYALVIHINIYNHPRGPFARMSQISAQIVYVPNGAFRVQNSIDYVANATVHVYPEIICIYCDIIPLLGCYGC